MAKRKKSAEGQTTVLKSVLSSPMLVVITVATIVVFMISFAGYVRRGGFWAPEVEARVFDRSGRARKGQTDDPMRSERTFPFQGEVYQRVERLREASALAYATTLVGVQATAERRPIANVEGLLGEVNGAGLLPPGMSMDQGGSAVNSANGVYYVRYRVDPLGVEVLSVGKGNAPGPPLLVRLPDDEFTKNALTYYVAPKVEGAQMPQAFASVGEIIGLGWKPEVFRAASVSTEARTN